MTYLLDTSALLAHARRESEAPRVQELFDQEDAIILLSSGRGRDSGCPEPPAQIPAGGTTAPGSYLE
jgi:hypothetical protein